MFEVDLSSYGINDDDMMHVQEVLEDLLEIHPELPRLSLNLSSNMITAKGCKMLNLILKLVKADLSSNRLKDLAIPYLIDTSITHLDLSQTGITDVGAQKLFENIANYSDIILLKNPGISKELLNKIGKHFGEKISPYDLPIGVDLGHTYTFFDPISYNSQKSKIDQPLNFKTLTPIIQISPEKKLAGKMCQPHAQEISSLSLSQKEELIRYILEEIGMELKLSSSAVEINKA